MTKAIVDKDEVKALDKPEVDGYVFIRYTHPITHQVTDGWVIASGLK
ncbi:hypothetical protein [Atlantibacter hermannii]|nr:hypothetical protein [Atlantibacter hermannii]